jgi:hypothetical protein
MLPDFDRAEQIGEFWGNPKTRTFAELLIDCEEDRTLRAVLVGMLREVDQGRYGASGSLNLHVGFRMRWSHPLNSGSNTPTASAVRGVR